MDSNVRVYVRPKPGCMIEKIISIQRPDAAPAIITLTNDDEAKKEYLFDGIFEPDCSQKKIFDECIQTVVSDALKGLNSIVCAYGQSGSGKTYTMVGSPQNQGIIPRLAEALYYGASAPESTTQTSAVRPRVTMTLIEIYQEVIYDLIDHRTDPLHKKDVPSLFQHCSSMYIDSVDGFYEEFQRCIAERKVASTNWNEESTRSHVVCVFDVEYRDTVSRIFCVDLSGSENVKESGADGQTLKEAGAINLSLFYLAEVVRAYNEHQRPSSYRQSSLTHLLKDAFGGNAKVTFIVTVREMLNETRRTLEFAQSLRRIRNKVHANLNYSLEQWRTKCLAAESSVETLRKQIRALEAENDVLRDTLQRNKIPLPTLLAVPIRSSSSSSSQYSTASLRSNTTMPLFVDASSSVVSLEIQEKKRQSISVDTFTDPDYIQEDGDAIVSTLFNGVSTQGRTRRRRRLHTRLTETLHSIDTLNRRVKALAEKKADSK